MSNQKQITYGVLTKQLIDLKNEYPFLTLSSIGRSFRGRHLHLVTFGKGRIGFFCVAAHHGAEGITSSIAVNYISDMCELIKRKRKIDGISTEYILEKERIGIIPMLNPDGVELSVNGCTPRDPMYNRLTTMNGGSDFSGWQANGRGVDLNHNYNSGFAEYKRVERQLGFFGGRSTLYSGEYPESEPEISAICRFLRKERPKSVITLHTQGEEIYYSSGSIINRFSYKNALIASRMTGYKLAIPSGTASYGGLLDYLTEKLDIPCITIECGRGTNPLPPDNLDEIYAKMKQLLISAPIRFNGHPL